MEGLPKHDEQMPHLAEVDEEFIAGLRLMAAASRRHCKDVTGHPAIEDDRYSLSKLGVQSLSRFFEYEGDRSLTLRVGRLPLLAHEIRPLYLSRGDLALYNEIWLPPGFNLEITGIHQHPYTLEVYLVNSDRKLAQQADPRAQEHTGIAVNLQQIDENWQPENGGGITVT